MPHKMKSFWQLCLLETFAKVRHSGGSRDPEAQRVATCHGPDPGVKVNEVKKVGMPTPILRIIPSHTNPSPNT